MPPRIICWNCREEAPRDARGLCHTCYQYQRRTGLPRPWVENAVLERMRLVKEGARV